MVKSASSAAIKKIFAAEGALRTGHFRLSSGLHSGQYIQCALVLRRPKVAARLGKMLAEKFRGVKADAVVSPALGGILAGYELARALGVEFMFTEREQEKMTLRRGFALRRGGKYIVGEDVLTTGRSTEEVVKVIRASGGKVVGAAALVARGPAPRNWTFPFHALLALSIPSYAPEKCPLCREGVPLSSPGSRHLRKT